MSIATSDLPQSLPEAHALIQQLQWQVDQLKKQLFGPSSDRAKLAENSTTEQTLLAVFSPPTEPPATQDVVVPAAEDQSQPTPAPARPRRRPEIKELEVETQRIEPAEKVCEHCGKEIKDDKLDIKIMEEAGECLFTAAEFRMDCLNNR